MISFSPYHALQILMGFCILTDAETHQDRAERVARLAEQQKQSPQAKVVGKLSVLTNASSPYHLYSGCPAASYWVFWRMPVHMSGKTCAAHQASMIVSTASDA